MSDWTSGYMADIDYTYGYYSELNPLRVRLALLQAGLHAPSILNACELGFGQGVTVNMHAAASPVSWAGTDFNPAHASFAQELAQVSGNGALLQEQAFEEFCQRSDLPDFDFIGMHGIWSWVSDANRSVLVDFLARKLKPGGVLYVSYNTQPGWAAMLPMRDLLNDYMQTMSAPGVGVKKRVGEALAFAQQLMATQPVYGLINTHIGDRISKLQEQDSHYVAHEYFNANWQPMGFSTMSRWLAPAKLQWACSAHFSDTMDAINLTEDQRTLLASIPDQNFRESVRDFCINQQFRKDYWVKGARQLSPSEQASKWREQAFVLIQNPSQVNLQIIGRQAQITFSTGIHGLLMDQLADHQVHTVGQLEQALKPHSVDFTALQQAIWALCIIGVLQPAQEVASGTNIQSAAGQLNAHLLAKAHDQNAVQCLACPATGGALSVTAFEQQFLLARQQGLQQPSEWGQHVWQLMQAEGKCLVVDGQVLQDPADCVAKLQAQAQTFAVERLPILQALGVV
jgi:SAM-dependent methyltransferase